MSMKMRRLVITAMVVVGVLALPATAALASSFGNGSDYGTQPGYNVANTQTDCAGHGSFDAFGKDYNLGNDVSGHYTGGSTGPGADGPQTGYNNSNLCGNPQGNP